jgi:AcrR family transcriptional regulator
MPRLSDTTRAQRRQHILTSAWRCFSRDGFHVTSMDQVIAETGMSSSAVYRYFRSKEQIIRATAEQGVVRLGRSSLPGSTATPVRIRPRH